MYYYWIPVAILFLAALFSDTNTWSPFQSDQVKAICAHMTKTERRAAIRRGAWWGLLVGMVPGMIALVLGVVVFRSALVVVTVCFLVLPLIALVLYRKWLPSVVRSQQAFLASTEWARSQGIKPEDIRLYKTHENAELRAVMDSNEFVYKPCWIAYFDLLGFRKRVEQGQLGLVLPDYHGAVAALTKEAHRDIRIRWFSDTFLFYMLDNSRESLFEIDNACRSFFHRMILKRIPLRGSLTVGNLYVESDDVLIGPALIEAYDYAERQDWLGFVLTPNARDKLRSHVHNGKTDYDVLCRHDYREYDVPVKCEDGSDCPKTEKLPAYIMNLIRFDHGNQDLDEARHIWDALEDMEQMARDESQSVRAKYEKTKEFLSETVPGLSR